MRVRQRAKSQKYFNLQTLNSNLNHLNLRSIVSVMNFQKLELFHGRRGKPIGQTPIGCKYHDVKSQREVLCSKTENSVLKKINGKCGRCKVMAAEPFLATTVCNNNRVE